MSTLEQVKGDIMKELTHAKVSTIVLVGETGSGKTWMAREISECAINEGVCYATFWVYMTEKYDVNLFYKDIDRQLSLCSITEEWEYAEKKKALNLKPDEFIQWGHTAEKADQEEEMTENLKERIREKLKGIGPALSVENKHLLLVVEDVGNNLHVKLPQDWISLFPSKLHKHLKLIITRRKLGDRKAKRTKKVITLLHLQQQESLQLLRKSVDKTVSEHQSFQQLDEAIAEKSEGKPAAIIVIAKALNYIAQHDVSTLGSNIFKAACYEKTSLGINPLFYCACDMIESSVTKNCFWHSVHLFHSYGGVHYNELIAHWIMEGYFNPVDQIEEAYQKGHGVLTELRDRALLNIQENNIITVEGAVLEMIDSCPHTFSLRLFSVLKDDERLGRVTQMDGMIKTLCNPKFLKNSTLLIDGSHISRVQSFFNSMKELKVLAVFNGRCESFFSSLNDMDKLLVLVLRGCELLDDIAHINQLKTLKVLEISGYGSHSPSMSDTLFDGMTNLQSLNLTGLNMKSLSSISSLRELRSLILRNFSCLEDVESLKELVKLEVLDLSGASSLKSMPSNLFEKTTSLHRLNLSAVHQMESFPSFSKLSELRVLILSRCNRLKKLKSLRGLGKLQILDLSYALWFESFGDSTFSVLPKLQMIDLSSTNIRSLPKFDQLKELTHISLHGCCNVRDLPKLQHLTSLQVLDLSGATSFKQFEDQSIENLGQLRILDLSKTLISKVPNIPRNLLELNLMDCSEVKDLPSTIYQENLQTTDAGWVPPRLSY